MDLIKAKELIKMVKEEKPSLVVGCALCDTWWDTNKKSIEEATENARSAGWRPYKEESICPRCRNIRKQAFLEAIREVEEIYRTAFDGRWDIYDTCETIKDALREKAEE